MGCNEHNKNINKTFIIEGDDIVNGDTFISTGYTVGNDLILSSNTGNLINISLPVYIDNDTYVTGGTYNNGLLTLINNSGVTFDVSGFTDCGGVYTNQIISCDGDAVIQLSTGETIFNTSIIPDVDVNIDIGSQLKRFREINTYSGSSTYWTASTSLTTSMVDLGVDSMGNNRQITADNSLIQNDVLNGGSY